MVLSWHPASPASIRHPLSTDAADLLEILGLCVLEHSSVKCRFICSTSMQLGRGAYGVVLLGHDLASEAAVAIKLIPSSRMRMREAYILQRLSDTNHPGLLRFYGHLHPAAVIAGEILTEHGTPLDEPCHAMVIEPVMGGELFEHVVEREGLQEADSAPLFAQLSDAVKAAHSMGIAHRDIKLENCLLVREGHLCLPPPANPQEPLVKLIDWGLAYQHAIGADGRILPDMLKARCGTRSYMAPEVASRDPSGYDAFAADVWSLGVCLFAMHTGIFPFECADPHLDWRAHTVREAQLAGRSTTATILAFYSTWPQTEAGPISPLSFGNSPVLSSSLVALIDRMLVFDPAERACIDEVLISEWLSPHVPSLAFLHQGPSQSLSDARDGSRTRSVVDRHVAVQLPRSLRVLKEMDMAATTRHPPRGASHPADDNEEENEGSSLEATIMNACAACSAQTALHEEWPCASKSTCVGERLEASQWAGEHARHLAGTCDCAFEGVCVGKVAFELTGHTWPTASSAASVTTGWHFAALIWPWTSLNSMIGGVDLLAATSALPSALGGAIFGQVSKVRGRTVSRQATDPTGPSHRPTG